MKKKLSVVFVILLVFVIAGLGVVTVADKQKNKAVEAGAVQSEELIDKYGVPASSKDEPSTEAISRVSLVAVGDNLIHDVVYEQALARGENGKYDFTYAYENIAKYIEGPDIAILNQETIISTDHEVSSYPCFNSPVEVGEEMLKIGFDVFNLSTNHSLDKGESGLISAINYWKGKKAITTGAYLNMEDFVIPTNEVNGVKFAYLGFTEQTNGLSLPSDSEVVLVLQEDEELLKSKIEQAKKMADVVIVNAHWGIEYDHSPSEEQRAMAQKLADWGADVVIGTHPHVIQPVEFVTAQDGSRTLVAYSLGNFISAQNRAPRMLGGMLNFNIAKNNATGEISIENVTFSGTVTHYGSGMSHIRVYSLADYTDELATTHGVRSSYYDFSKKYLNDLLAEVVDAQFIK